MPDVRQQLEISIALGRGVDRPIGWTATAGRVSELAALLEQHRGREAWWSGSYFASNHRSIEHWRGASVLVAQVDTADHGPVDDALAERLAAVA